MSDPSHLENLLASLREGEEAAAEKIYLAYEPYLRVVVRRQLSAAMRAYFDSADIVQSVWADLLVHFRKNGWRFANPTQLQAFLVQATQNRLIDRYRERRTAITREQSFDVDGNDWLPSPTASPSELAGAEDFWRRIEEQCSESHLEILRLRRSGHTIAEIAESTGMHPSSVRRIIYDIAKRLRDEGVGGSDA